MKERDVRKYLYDIASACDLLTQFTANRTLEQYAADVSSEIVWGIVEHNLPVLRMETAKLLGAQRL